MVILMGQVSLQLVVGLVPVVEIVVALYFKVCNWAECRGYNAYVCFITSRIIYLTRRFVFLHRTFNLSPSSLLFILRRT